MDLVHLVGANIAARRKQLGISQKELAIQLNVTQDAMSRMENGRAAPHLKRVEELARILRCPPIAFFLNGQESSTLVNELMTGLSNTQREAVLNLMAQLVMLVKTGGCLDSSASAD